jgi:hypothetical protein
MPERRKLKFDAYEEVIQQIEALEGAGHSMAGKWTLGQVCAHLDYYFKGSLDGHADMLPWPIRVFIGKPMLWWILNKGTMGAGGPTAPKSVPAGSDDRIESVASAKANLRRLTTATALHPSAFFGELSVERWRKLHLTHAAHHLGFLIPNR